MSGYRPRSQDIGHSLEPFIIDRDPLIVDRSPEEPLIRRASYSGTAKPKRSTLVKIYNPLTHRTNDKVVLTQRTVIRRNRDGKEESSSPRDTTERGRAPAPPVITQRRRSRSAPSGRRNTKMSPTPGQQGYVPLPPKLPEVMEGGQPRGRGSGRESRQSRRSPYDDEGIQIIEEPGTGRRSPRPYHHRPQNSDPHDVQEQVLTPQSPLPRQSTPQFEIVQPNEPVRSRQRDDVVYHNKEYIRMKALAEHNYKAAEKAAERYASAEVRLQNLQQQLASTEKQLGDMKFQQSKASDREERLQQQLEQTLRELSECRREHRISSRERELSAYQAKLAEDQLELERRRSDERRRDVERRTNRSVERERERGRDEREHDSGENSNRRRRHRVVRLHQDSDEPRSKDTRDPREPRSSAIATGTNDPGMDAIMRARADAAKQDRSPYKSSASK